MRRLSGYSLGVGVILLVVWLRPVGAGTRVQQQPLAWFGVHSFQRLEQRFLETGQLAKMPGIAQLVLGFLRTQWGGFKGLDRQRPIGMVLPTLAPGEKLSVVWVIPYSDRRLMWATLQRFFPGSTMASGSLVLRGKFGQRFGRFDEDTKCLLIARETRLLQGPEVRLPDVGFRQAEGTVPATDIVLHIDVAAVKKRHPSEWQALLDQMRLELRQSRAMALTAARTKADTAFVTVAFGLLKERQDQALGDLQRVESRLSLASTQRWVADLEMWMQSGSMIDMFLKLQTASAHPLPFLFSQDVSMRGWVSIRQPSAWQQDTRQLLLHWQRSVESHLDDPPAVTPEYQVKKLAGIRAGFSVLKQSLDDPFIYLAAEVNRSSSVTPRSPAAMQMTGWLRLMEGRSYLETLLKPAVSSLKTEAELMLLTQEVARHGGVPVRRVNLSLSSESLVSRVEDTLRSTSDPTVINPLFVTADHTMMAWHVGTSFTPLTQWLDRKRRNPPAAAHHRSALLSLEAPVAQVLNLMWKAQDGRTENGLGRRVVERLREVDTPMWVTITPEEATVSTHQEKSVDGLSAVSSMKVEQSIDELGVGQGLRLRMVLPRAVLQSVVDMVGQELLQMVGQSWLRR